MNKVFYLITLFLSITSHLGQASEALKLSDLGQTEKKTMNAGPLNVSDIDKNQGPQVSTYYTAPKTHFYITPTPKATEDLIKAGPLDIRGLTKKAPPLEGRFIYSF